MKDGDTFVDIGSGYGRVGCVVGVNFPNSRFLGYEIVQERVIEAQRVADNIANAIVGEAVGLIHDVRPAAEILASVSLEAEALLNSTDFVSK